MIEVLRTTDAIELSFAEHLLTSAGIDYTVADRHMSIMEGSIGIFPRRVLVDEDWEKRALDALEELFAKR